MAVKVIGFPSISVEEYISPVQAEDPRTSSDWPDGLVLMMFAPPLPENFGDDPLRIQHSWRLLVLGKFSEHAV
jgi:hypothetical protein